ncbi:MAG: immune inhibitor A [Ignavibacteriaceae bacterium]|nr:immune inhibitor A [Ignavibacteriaceae bacterium]
MRRLFFLLLLIFQFSLFPQNYKQVKIYVEDFSQIKDLYAAGIAVDHFEKTKDNSVIQFLSDQEFDRLKMLNFRYEVLIDDWYAHYNSRASLTEAEKQNIIADSKMNFGVEGLTFGSMGGYLTLSEVYQKLDSMKILFPNIITSKIQIGTTLENRPMYAVKISDNPDINENEPGVLYTALTHAREPGGMMTVMYYMYWLLENYGTNPQATYLVNNRQVYFIPVVNPDGYEYNRSTNPNGGGMWRKNRKNNGGSYGVDLNRNFGPENYWNSPYGGSSTSPSADDYRGTAPFSEPESQVIRDFLVGKNIKSSLNYHTYSNILIYPYGWNPNVKTPDSLAFLEYAQDMTAWNGYEYGTADELLYPVRGVFDDYYYDGNIPAHGKIFSMTPEVGSSTDGFWPAQSRIFPLAQINLNPNIYLSMVAGEFVSTKNYTLNRQYINPGDSVEITLQLRNKGISTANNVNIQLTSLNNYAAVTSGSSMVDSIQSFATVSTSSPLKFVVSQSAPAEAEVKLLSTVTVNGIVTGADTIKMIVGIPTYIFNDTTNNPTVKWVMTATPSTNQWDASTTSFHSAPNSYTDSKSGNYLSNATVTITSKDPVDLSQFAAPKMTFWSKWDIETKWDCGVIQISTNNGANWSYLSATSSKPASGSGKQVPAGIPMYDGLKSNWNLEEVNLQPYAGQQIKLRFELRTDGSIVKDGWYLDDLGIFIYSLVPVELTSFTAEKIDNAVKLSWSTKSELNNLRFDIQRLNPEGWKTIGSTAGKGTTTEPSAYTFNDLNPLTGKNLYRLKQIDYDGTYRLFSSNEVYFEQPKTYSLSQNYPNPFNPSTKISFSLPLKEKVTLKVFNLLGAEVATLADGIFDAGEHSLSFNAGSLTSGVYFYEIKTESFAKRMKMMLMK